jgi:hypothetical protein
MKTEPQRTCPSCSSEFSGAMDFCPVCMLRMGLAGGVDSGESSVSEETVERTPEQASQRFEHYELVRGQDGNRSSWVGVRWVSHTKPWTSIYDAQWH